MSYSSAASALSEKNSLISDSLSQIKQIPFDTVWGGDVSSHQFLQLKSVLSNIEKVQKNISSLQSALGLLDTYKSKKESIASYQSCISSSTDESYINKTSQKISSLESECNILRGQIMDMLSGIQHVTSIDVAAVNYTLDTSGRDYVVDLYDMLKLFQSGSLTKIGDVGKTSLYDYYSQEEVENRINQIKSQYTGRDAAVNCALGIMQMAADVGLKLDYDWGGGHREYTSVADVASGTDCSAFASWAINQGSPSGFQTTTTSYLINKGERVDFEHAKKGDILVYQSGDSGHVVMIVDNDPESQNFLVVEAAGSSSGVIMQTRSYSSLSGAYEARNLENIYNE